MSTTLEVYLIFANPFLISGHQLTERTDFWYVGDGNIVVSSTGVLLVVRA
ncbi:MAG: hypothetical protein ABSD96_10010 [Candidatus Korobacteraceae bacterium]